jgi:hypothetical protein
MSRPRKPTATLEETGAFIKNPERKRQRSGEPIPTAPLGDPPAHLGLEERAIWLELSALMPPNVAKNSDRFAVEIIVCLMANFRKHRATVGEIAQLSSLLGRMGLTASDRSRIKTTNDPRQDPLEAFLSRKPTSEVAQ